MMTLPVSAWVAMPLQEEMQHQGHVLGPCAVTPAYRSVLVSPDDFQQPGGDVATFAASFGNSWKIPDTSPQVPGQSRVWGVPGPHVCLGGYPGSEGLPGLSPAAGMRWSSAPAVQRAMRHGRQPRPRAGSSWLSRFASAMTR